MTETNYLIITHNFCINTAKLIILCKHDVINNKFWETLRVIALYELRTQWHVR
jgi:hypothetical protein